jgi:hypothetical protein
MKHLKKFIRMKYGLRSQHRVDIIYAGECLRDDFCLMDVAYTFSWKRVSVYRSVHAFKVTTGNKGSGVGAQGDPCTATIF